MPEYQDFVMVMTSCDDRKEADRIAFDLLEKKLAACVNVFPIVRTHYLWKGKVVSGDEAVVIIKTELSKTEAIKTEIKEKHSYSNPEVLVIPIIGGSSDYMRWVSDVISDKKKKKTTRRSNRAVKKT